MTIWGKTFIKINITWKNSNFFQRHIEELFFSYFSVDENFKFVDVSSIHIYKITCCELLNPVEFVSELFPAYIPDDVVKLLPEIKWKIMWITKTQYWKITSILQLYHKAMAYFNTSHMLTDLVVISSVTC